MTYATDDENELIIESRIGEGYVYLQLPSELHYMALAGIFQRTASLASRHGLQGILFDARGMEDRLIDWPLYIFRDAGSIFHESKLSCAILAGPAGLAKLRFIENLAFSRALPLRVFFSFDDVLDWFRPGPDPA